MRHLLSISFILIFVAVISAQTAKTPKTVITSKSAKTGQYVTKSYANSHPATTYTSKKKK